MGAESRKGASRSKNAARATRMEDHGIQRTGSTMTLTAMEHRLEAAHKGLGLDPRNYKATRNLRNTHRKSSAQVRSAKPKKGGDK